MTLFVDTSALYALMDADDPNHARGAALWRETLAGPDVPVTHNYVVLEACALVQRRLGIQALQDLVDNLLDPLATVFVDEELHRTATSAVLSARLRDLSLVDAVSFEVMRRLAIRQAFAFGARFEGYGFELAPN